MPRERSFKWGVLYNGDKLTLDDIVRFAGQAEQAGAESIWAAELWRDAFVPLTAIASNVRNVRLGTAVAHFARPPMLTELGAMSLAEYTRGRFILGLGTAPKDWNERWHGLEYRRPVARMKEYVECIRTMWQGSPEHGVDYAGEFYTVRDYRRLTEPPYRRIPIYLAAVLPRMIRLAGSLADGIILNVLNTPRYFREVVHPHLQTGFARRADGAAGFEVCAVKCCAVHARRAEARKLARHAVAFYATLPYFDAVLDPAGFTKEKRAIRDAMQRHDVATMLTSVTDDMIDALVLAGTPDDVRHQLRAFAGLFDTLLLLSPSFAADPQQVQENNAAMIAAFAE